VYRFCIQSLTPLIVFAGLAMAAPPQVGIVTSVGSFTLDDSAVTANATLFEGSRIETGDAPCRLQLNEGGKLLLGAESKGIVYQDRFVLERGSGRFENYIVEVSTLRVRTESALTFAEVAIRNTNIAGPGMVRVGAFKGPVRVSTAAGKLLVNLQAGHTFDFETPDTQNAAAATPLPGHAPAASPAPAGVGIAAKVATVAVVAAGAGTAAAVAVVKNSDEPAISPSTR